jgi:hypothetical protein
MWSSSAVSSGTGTDTAWVANLGTGYQNTGYLRIGAAHGVVCVR